MMARKNTYKKGIRYGKTFRTRRGRIGRYKYVNGRKIAFVENRRKY